MKSIFLVAFIFLFIASACQEKDTLNEMEQRKVFNATFFDNIKGKELPDFSARDVDGQVLSGKKLLKGKVTFLSFWFESCAPCIAEIPNLNRLYKMTRGNSKIQFYSITWETESKVSEAIAKYDMRFPILRVSQQKVQQLNFDRGFPTNMVVDSKGRVFSILSGGSRNPGPEFETFWKQEIESAVKNKTVTELKKPILNSQVNPNIIFVDSVLSNKSLNDLFGYFKEKILYVDLWATWCVPCLREFKTKNNSVDSFLKVYNIIPIYLSIDNPGATDTWRRIIYENQLTGYHLMAGRKLMEEIKQKVYNNSPSIVLPRYIIVKDRKIIEINAAPPGLGQKLMEQLTEIL